MKIHEYQAKNLLRNYGVSVPEGYPAFSVEEALEAYDKLNSETVVVKAQIHAGGRGKGGGVELAHSKSEVQKIASKILGMQLVTHQTVPEGKEVQRLLIESGINILTELYAGIVLDRVKKQFVFMVSTEGGVEIEKVACTMNISLDDFEPMLTGCLDPLTAFMGGKMKVTGDMGVAMKLQNMFG